MIFEVAARSTVILAAAWLLTRLMPRASAATRHLVWHGALLAVVLAPILSPLVPLIPLTTLAKVVEVARVNQVHPVQQVEQLEPVQQVQRPTSQVSLADPPLQVLNSDVLQLVALLGSALCALWFGAGWWSAARVARKARAAPPEWQLEVNALCDRMRITREVRLRIFEGATSPLATGVRRASVLLPQTSASWTADRRHAVLLHELAHVRRDDCRVQLIAHAACALFWFNPLVWIAAAHLRSERERACDDEVLGLGARPSSYAGHLLDLAREIRPSLGPSAALAMARPSELEGRLLAVLATSRARVPVRGSRWAVATVLTVTSAVALGATPRSPQDGPPQFTPPARTYRIGFDATIEEDRRAVRHERTTAEQVLETSRDPQDRERAVLALAFTSGRDVIPALLDALGDADAQVREKAAIGLALRRDARVVEPLIAAMSDPDSQVREKVAIALGTSGDARTRDVLTQALEDPDSQVREKATAALVLLGVTSR